MEGNADFPLHGAPGYHDVTVCHGVFPMNGVCTVEHVRDTPTPPHADVSSPTPQPAPSGWDSQPDALWGSPDRLNGKPHTSLAIITPKVAMVLAVVVMSTLLAHPAEGYMLPMAFYDQAHYEVVMVEEEADPSPDGIMMTNAAGVRYSCVVPRKEVEDRARQKQLMKESLEDKNALGRIVAELERHLSPLKGQCFHQTAGWWTYEFCYKKHVRQYHQDNSGVILNEFVLGDHEVAATHDQVKASTQDSRPYYPHQYTQGTECHILTGQRRSVEVQFRCSEGGAQGAIADVKEPASCQYVVSFMTPLVCKVTALFNKRDDSHKIRCVRAPQSAAEALETQTRCSAQGCKDAVDLTADPADTKLKIDL